MTPYTTPKGVQIGRCYIKPATRVQGDAVVIQSALLAKRRKPSNPDHPVVLAILIVLVIFAICIGSQA